MYFKPSSQQISYKDLVNKYFIKLLDKKETNSDWSKRPLSATQLEYASNDKIFTQDNEHSN